MQKALLRTVIEDWLFQASGRYCQGATKVIKNSQNQTIILLEVRETYIDALKEFLYALDTCTICIEKHRVQTICIQWVVISACRHSLQPV